MGNSLAGFDVAVIQAQGEQLLKAGIDLLVHGGVLRRDIAELIDESLTALVVVALCVLQPLIMLCAALKSFGRTGLGVHGAGALHSWRWCGASNLPLAAGLLLLGWGCDGGGLG